MVGNVTGFPGGEKFFELGSDLGERGVTDDEKRGIVGLVPGVVEFGEIFAGHFGDGFGGAGADEGFVVRMAFAVEDCRAERAGPSENGVTFSRGDGGETLFLQTVEFFLREGRMEDKVGVNIERLIEIRFEGVETDVGIIEIGAGIEIGAEGFEFFA